MGLGWWLSYRAIDAKRLAAVQQAHRQRATLERASAAHQRLEDEVWLVQPVAKTAARWHIDWSVLDEPLVEP